VWCRGEPLSPAHRCWGSDGGSLFEEVQFCCDACCGVVLRPTVSNIAVSISHDQGTDRAMEAQSGESPIEPEVRNA
jgi:hypothetical protein